MKFIFWMLLIGAIVVFLRRQGALPAARRHVRRPAGAGGDSREDAPRAAGVDAPDLMLACSVCGVHLPASEAIMAHGRVYCCEEHRMQAGAAHSGRCPG